MDNVHLFCLFVDGARASHRKAMKQLVARQFGHLLWCLPWVEDALHCYWTVDARWAQEISANADLPLTKMVPPSYSHLE